MTEWLRRRAGALAIFIAFFLVWEVAVRMLGIADADLVRAMETYQENLNAEAKAKNANLGRG